MTYREENGQESRLHFDGIKFGWLADGRWPLKFWEAFWIHRQFTLCGPMTTVAMGPLILWIYWSRR